MRSCKASLLAPKLYQSSIDGSGFGAAPRICQYINAAQRFHLCIRCSSKAPSLYLVQVQSSISVSAAAPKLRLCIRCTSKAPSLYPMQLQSSVSGSLRICLWICSSFYGLERGAAMMLCPYARSNSNALSLCQEQLQFFVPMPGAAPMLCPYARSSSYDMSLCRSSYDAFFPMQGAATMLCPYARSSY